MKFITNFFKKREARAKAEAMQDLLETLKRTSAQPNGMRLGFASHRSWKINLTKCAVIWKHCVKFGGPWLLILIAQQLT